MRCAHCRFSWFQEGEPAAENAASIVRAQTTARDAPGLSTLAAPAARPIAVTPEELEPAQDPDIDWTAPVEDYDEGAGYRPRRDRSRLWTVAAVVAALLMIGAIGAVSWFGVEPLTAMAGLDDAPETRLGITGRVSRDTLPTNTELLTVTGEIRNLTDDAQRVPQIRAELLDGERRVVFSWAIAPPVQELAPRQTVSFNAAARDVPPGARNLVLGFVPLT